MTTIPGATASQRTNIIIFGLFALCNIVGLISAQQSFAGKNFPLYYVIQDNVLFWEKIYGTYSLNEAVIHDSEDLSKVYEVIALIDTNLPGAGKFNRQLKKRKKKKYEKLLKKLSRQRPQSSEEKRIVALFSGKYSMRKMGRAAENVRTQTGQKERFKAGVIRSGAYLKEMKKIFKRNGLPEELAYLPHVESSFNYQAYSKFGAAGIWQFTRATGKEYLTVDYILDERRDPLYATHAAAKYLKNSYRNLGNWPLAITSYNYGLSGTMRAVKDKKTYGNIFKTYKQGHFKFASRNFYSEFLAALKVAKRLENSPNIQQDSPLHCSYFSLPGYIHIKDVTRHFNLPKNVITKLNPGLRKPVLKGEKFIPKGYSLRLPTSNAISRKIVLIPNSLFHQKQRTSNFHRVQRGETAGTVAAKHGVSLKRLIAANNLNKNATIFIKQKLRIPSSSSTTTTSTYSSVPKFTARYKEKKSQLNTRRSRPILSATKKRRPVSLTTTLVPKIDPTLYNVYGLHRGKGRAVGYITVQPEESLGLYAEWLGTNIQGLATLNGFKKNRNISPGQKVKLTFDNQLPRHFEDKRLDFLQETEEDFFSAFSVVGQIIYRVTEGDTFWDLCYNKFDIPLWLLERYNRAINLSTLNKRQKLVIPLVQPI